MMAERDSLIGSYVHLASERRADEALHILKKIASQVKPIMRARGWKVSQLAEFHPADRNLLGLNVNRGQKICLRLRHAADSNQFLPYEHVLDTMLHELVHNVHGPHNQQFHALWDQLRDECQGLIMKGYTGEGFLGPGRQLGGARMPASEARRLAREAAEKRRILSLSAGKSSGQRLGGAAPQPGQDIRQIIASAAERRNTVLRGCATERFNDVEIIEIADTATRNGFSTQAEEDEANEVAIAQALWELVQEDEKAKHGPLYIPSWAGHAEGHGGGPLIAETPNAPTIEAQGFATNGPRKDAGQNSVNVSIPEDPNFWACQVCTLHNPLQVLSCDACGSERRSQAKRPRLSGHNINTPPGPLTNKGSATRIPTTIDLTGDSPPPKRTDIGIDTHAPARKQQQQSRHPTASSSSSSSAPEPPWVWICSVCGTAMERQWWTCSLCGKMKESSR